jgi:amino acid transporter
MLFFYILLIYVEIGVCVFIIVVPVLLIVLILPIAWFISELKNSKKSIRCTLGILAILSCFGVAVLAAQIVRLNYNIWYSSATAKLLDSTINQLENKETKFVIKELKTLREKIPVTYEFKGNYNELAAETTKKMKAYKNKDK